MYTKADIEKLAEDFENCRKVLVALGDGNRQHLILEMMKMENCFGARVGDITERTHLSRPAVSHHFPIPSVRRQRKHLDILRTRVWR